MPFAWSDGTCDFCREGLQTSCRHGGFWNANGAAGGQAEAIRVPLADGTLVAAPVEEDSPLIPSLLGREFGATHVVAERGDDGIEKVRDLTGGEGTHVVVGHVTGPDAHAVTVRLTKPGQQEMRES